MKTANEIKTAVFNLGIAEFVVRDCSMCGYALKYLFRGDQIYYDCGCWCVDYGPRVEPRTWDDLAAFYNMQTSPKVIADMNAVLGFQCVFPES